MDANDAPPRDTLAAQLRLATAFLTRLPADGRREEPDAPEDRDEAEDGDAPSPGGRDERSGLADAMWLFPLVGFGIGGAGAIALAALAWAGVPAPVAAALAVGAMAWLTGALHEDGLCDTADGFGGGDDVARKLEIMRDSRLGAYGAITLAVVIVAKIAALAAMAAVDIGAAAGALIAAAAWSRAMFAPIIRRLDPARDSGLGAAVGIPTPADAGKGFLLGALLVLLVLATPTGPGVILVLLAGWAGAFAVGQISLHQIDGYTGDVLGAAQQISETAALVAASAVIAGAAP